MAKSFQALVKVEFQRALEAELPEFVVDPTSPTPAMLFFRSNRWAPLTMFLTLLFSEKGDRFTIEVAWNTKAEMPGLKSFAIRNVRDRPPVEGALRTRLDSLIDERERWWTPTAKTKEEVVELVADALSSVREYAIPYFDSVSTPPAGRARSKRKRQ